MNIFLDLESVPDQRPGALDAFLADARENFRAPSTLTKEQAAADLGMTDPGEIKFTSKDAMLAKWAERFREEKAEEVGDANWRKTSFDGSAGQIVCIGFYADGHSRGSMSASSYEGMDERVILQDFYSWLMDIHDVRDRPRFVGHNIIGFDLRFLWQRSMVLGVRPPLWFPRDARPWDTETVFDTMTQWAGTGNRISLDNLCRALGIPGKTEGVDGALVWDFVRDGRLEEVAEYCRNDVEITRQAFQRMTFQEAA